MVTQEQVNRWCEIGVKLGKAPDLADTLWRFSYQLEQRQTTKAHLMELYQHWYDHQGETVVLPAVVEEMT